ncbi:MAG TPA: DUF4352 domain-containing protein [Bacteroidales bacterium]|nr:DUF4352 domain-containing protein [Bacteroidales bacterium]
MKREKIKKPIYKKWWVWLLAVVIIGAALSGGDEEEKIADSGNEVVQETTDPAVEEIQEVEAVEDVVEVGIGESAKIADVSFTVNSIEETKEISSGNEYIENATTEGKYIILEITVKNEKKEALTIHSSYFKLITSEDVVYEPNTDGKVMMAMMDEDDFFLQQVNPGLSKTGKVVFEVGEDLDLNTAILKGQTGFWGTESVEISLKQ